MRACRCAPCARWATGDRSTRASTERRWHCSRCARCASKAARPRRCASWASSASSNCCPRRGRRLAERFGRGLHRRLDEALGTLPEPIEALFPDAQPARAEASSSRSSPPRPSHRSSATCGGSRAPAHRTRQGRAPARLPFPPRRWSTPGHPRRDREAVARSCPPRQIAPRQNRERRSGPRRRGDDADRAARRAVAFQPEREPRKRRAAGPRPRRPGRHARQSLRRSAGSIAAAHRRARCPSARSRPRLRSARPQVRHGTTICRGRAGCSPGPRRSR